ncbi:MAG TPA: hypothetical protein VE127_11815 [Solirubrobacteraceae bacterium]|nr:hypothetical protein [Solirubrobacteraceae bacterium]
MRSLLRRRPSPAIVISSVALFMSLGGVGYAATQLPHNSVGPYQLRNHAVTYKKIMPNAVGRVRANTGQLQTRIWKTCGPNMAMNGAMRGGDPKCFNTLPAEVGTTSNSKAVPTTTTTPTGIAAVNLTAGDSYLALANPTVTVTTGKGAKNAAAVSVTCTLAVGGNTDKRTIEITTPTPSTTAAATATQSIPMQLKGTGGTAGIACQSTSPNKTAPTVGVTSAIDAIQIQ